jgi:hypothetical protein
MDTATKILLSAPNLNDAHNVVKLFEECKEMNPQEERALCNFLIGYLAQNISSDKWDEAIKMGRRAAKIGVRP